MQVKIIIEFEKKYSIDYTHIREIFTELEKIIPSDTVISRIITKFEKSVPSNTQ